MAPFVVTDYTVTRDKYIEEKPLYANYDIDEASAVIKLSVTSARNQNNLMIEKSLKNTV
jgi:hypothetical protein